MRLHLPEGRHVRTVECGKTVPKRLPLNYVSERIKSGIAECRLNGDFFR